MERKPTSVLRLKEAQEIISGVLWLMGLGPPVPPIDPAPFRSTVANRLWLGLP